MAHQIFATVPRLPVPRLPPGGSLSTPKILSTGATLHLGPIHLHIENWECWANRHHSAKNLACRADFFSACKWGFKDMNILFEHLKGPFYTAYLLLHD